MKIESNSLRNFLLLFPLLTLSGSTRARRLLKRKALENKSRSPFTSTNNAKHYYAASTFPHTAFLLLYGTREVLPSLLGTSEPKEAPLPLIGLLTKFIF